MIRIMRKFLLLLGCSFCLGGWSDASYYREFPESIRIDEQVSKMKFTLSGQHQITIPLRQVGKLMVIEAKIDSLIGNFILDTGAPGLVLNKTYFRDYKTVYLQEGGGVTGSAGEVMVKEVGSLSINNLEYKDLQAKVTDLSHIENKRGIKILGLIGIDLLKDFGMIIDFSGRQLELHCLDEDGFPISGSFREKLVDKSNKIVLVNHVLLVSGMISGKKLDFTLDTGAEMSILSSGIAEKCKEDITISQSTRLGGVANQSIDVLYAAIKNLQVGSQSIDNLPVLISDLSAMSQSYGVKIDGMLGNDFFNVGEIYINLKQKYWRIKPQNKYN